jgi:uncharacterized protein (DUF1697 family)
MRYVGFVRNVMLGREGLHRDRLLDAVARVGGSGGRSYLTTGNVTFDAAPEEIDELVRCLEIEVSRTVSRPTMVAVREHQWLRRLVAEDPFRGIEAAESALEVAFLRHTASPLDPRSLPASGRTCVVATFTRELATARPRTGPDRPHVNTLLERASGEGATSRAWSTLCRIAAGT